MRREHGNERKARDGGQGQGSRARRKQAEESLRVQGQGEGVVHVGQRGHGAPPHERSHRPPRRGRDPRKEGGGRPVRGVQALPGGQAQALRLHQGRAEGGGRKDPAQVPLRREGEGQGQEGRQEGGKVRRQAPPGVREEDQAQGLQQQAGHMIVLREGFDLPKI